MLPQTLGGRLRAHGCAASQLGGDDVSATLLGQSIVFDPGGDVVVGAIYAGLTGEYQCAGGVTIYASAAGWGEHNGSYGASGHVGVRMPF